MPVLRGSLLREAAPNFQHVGQTFLSVPFDLVGQTFLSVQFNQEDRQECLSYIVRLQQQPRYQFCSSPHAKLDEDVTQVEFHRLLTHEQTQSDLSVG